MENNDRNKKKLGIIVENLLEDSELFSDSDSSEDAEINLETEERLAVKNKRVQIENFNSTIDRYSDEEFKRHFRLSRQTANHCIDILQNSNKLPSHLFGREKVPTKQAFLMSLWYLCNQETYRQISDCFNVSESTAHVVIKCVVQHLVERSSLVIMWPDDGTSKIIDVEFERKQGLKGVIGAIDGSYILINQPKNNQEAYCNRKGMHSIIIQGVVDYRKRFIDVFCGEAGSIHDARVLKRSSLYQRAMDGQIDFKNRYLLGDSAYPTSLNWLVTPFKGNGHLSVEQHNFNYRHSSTRIVVENAFGLLKGRFWRLRHFDNKNISFIVECVVAACVLHNICIDGHESEGHVELAESDNSDTSDEEDKVQPLGLTRRQILYNSLYQM